MAEIRDQEQFDKVRAALKAGEFRDDPAMEAEILAAAEAWKATSAAPDAGAPAAPGIGQRSALGYSSASNLVDAAQGVGSFLAKPIATIGGGLAGGVDTLYGGAQRLFGGGPESINDRAVETANSVTSAISNNPLMREPTGSGKVISDTLAYPFEKLGEGAKGFADVLGDKSVGVGGIPGLPAGLPPAAIPSWLRGPAAQTLAETSVTGLPALFGLKGMGSKVKAPTVRSDVLQEANAVGYKVPTSSMKPDSLSLGLTEGLAGKPRLQQEISYKNQATTNRLVAEELGLPAGVEITLDSLNRVRNEAGQAYAALENAGTIATTTVFRRDLSNALSGLRAASKDFPVLAKKDGPIANAIETVNGLNKPTFEASSVAPVTRILRDDASAAFKNGNKSAGNALRDAATAIENAAEAHLVRVGSPEAIANFRAARERIAKSYSVEAALEGDGFVSATKLANQRGKRAPLTGNLDLIARFAEQFPKSAKVVKETPIKAGSLTGVVGSIGSTLALAAGGGPLLSAVPLIAALGRPGIRALTSSGPVQSLLSRPGMTTQAGAPTSGLLSTRPDEAQQ